LPAKSTSSKPRKTLRRASEQKPHADKALRIGAVARQLGISASMIRSWERVGVRRDTGDNSERNGSHRLYNEADIQLLCRAVHLRRVDGLNAPAIVAQLEREGMLKNATAVRPVARARATGKHLRALRLEKGKSLAEVAEAVDISIGFLSNLERSQTGVSLGIMHRLANYYGTSLSEFFYQADSPGPLVRKGQGRALAGGDGVNMEILAWGKIMMEPHLFHIAPGKGSSDSYTHQGEEFLYLLKGTLTIHLGDEEFALKAGDSFYFQSSVRHSWVNNGRKEAVILWINCDAS